MNFFGTLNQKFARYNTERRAINQLRAMSDRDLMDMGLSRGMIPGAVRKGVSGR